MDQFNLDDIAKKKAIVEEENLLFVRYIAIISWVWSAIFILFMWFMLESTYDLIGEYEIDEVGGVIYESYLIQLLSIAGCSGAIVSTIFLYYGKSWGLVPYLLSQGVFMFLPIYSYFFSHIHAVTSIFEVLLYTIVPFVLLLLFGSYFLAKSPKKQHKMMID